jgi:hypothetical protein
VNRTPGKVGQVIKAYAEKVWQFKQGGPETRSGVTVDPADISVMELRVAVPENTNAAQWEAIQGAIEDAQTLMGVKVIVTPTTAPN